MGLVSATLLYVHQLETGVASSNVEIARLRRKLAAFGPIVDNWLARIWGTIPDFPMPKARQRKAKP